jgi:acyl transferase domain-containing protein/acyl-CoA synthetase (AMP-forming)/AMP-acid ligase II
MSPSRGYQRGSRPVQVFNVRQRFKLAHEGAILQNREGCEPKARLFAGDLVGRLARSGLSGSTRSGTLTFLNGDANAITVGFDEIDASARRIALALRRAGAAGERALLLSPQGLEYIAALFGCLYAGVVAVPLYPPRRRGANARLQSVAVDCDARFYLSPHAMLDDAAKALSSPGVTPLSGIATDLLDDDDEPVPGPQGDRTGVAFLQYTSGSTGTPKGVMVTHASLTATLEDMDRAYRHRPESVIVSWLPLFHDLGLIYGALQPVYSGCSGVWLSPASFLQRPLRWLKVISEYRGTHSAAPNFGYEACLRRIAETDLAGLDLSSWEVSLNAAEPIREETNRRFIEFFAPCGLRPQVISPGYGLAEATLKVTSTDNGMHRRALRVEARALAEHRVVLLPSNDPAGQDICGCGLSHIGTRIAIVDPVTHRSCSADQVGEIWVQGRSVAAGYFRRPVETLATFGARLGDTGEGSFLRTGDLGFIRDGELYVTGRLSDVIIVRGQNHYPQDIEQTVQACHPALASDCGVAFACEADGEERIVIVNEVSRHGRHGLDPEAVFAAVRRAVAEEHDLQVHAIVLIRPSSLPKTSSGKVMRRNCRARFLAGDLDAVAAWRRDTAAESARGGAPEGAGPDEASIRHWLRGRVAALAGMRIEMIDCGESLSQFGIDSVSLVSLSGELGDRIGRHLPPTLFYDLPSIDAAARSLAGRHGREGRTGVVTDGPVAVIGVACRFPGGESVQAFWSFLRAGRDAVAPAPPDRGLLAASDGTPHRGCFLPRVDLFDAQFFGVSRREAERMDPQQRLLLEVAWEALENAAIAPASLAGSRGGVFIGISTADYMRLQAGMFDSYTATGNAFSIAANRLSYRLDLRGPSVAVDSACSSSLVAVHQASDALRRGDCDLALAGGVNVILSADLSLSLDKAGMLAADGRCKVFDADADGYGRGEGCGIVVLKRLGDAVEAGDDVLAVLCGTAVNQDGRSNGLTAPNGAAQQAVIRAALDRAGVRPAEIGWIECHGTGTLLGDPIEVGALTATLLEGRHDGRPLWLTSVKANIGHLEAAAGIAGLIKAVLGLRHAEVPGQVGLRRVNPHLAIEGTPVEIPVSSQPWPAGERYAGVSSFGFGGTNAHAVLKAAPTPAPRRASASPDLLCLSARSRPALVALALRYAGFLTETDLPLADICWTALMARNHFAHRLSVVADSAGAIAAALQAFAAGRPAEGVFLSREPVGEPDEAGSPPVGSDRLTAVTEAAKAYVAGRNPDSAALYGGSRRRACLPTYPFRRQRYWFDGSHSPGGPRGPTLSAEAARCFHRVEWMEAPLIERSLPDGISEVLVFDDERGVGADLADVLRARSRRAFLVRPGGGFARLSPTSWRADLTQPADLARVVSEVAAECRGPSDLVFLATCDDLALATDTTTAAALEAAQMRGTLALIRVLQAMLAQDGARMPRVRIVTRAAIRIGSESGAVNLAHAGVWGLLRTLLLEQPGLEAVAVDFGSDGTSVQEEAATLLAELGAPAGEDHVVYRGGRRLVGRLRRRAPSAGRPIEIAADRCHLLTGALGSIGLRLAHRLIDRGARDIVLTARREPNQNTSAMLDKLRELGARIDVACVDVADEAAMAALLDRLDRAGRPLAGVMHLAGVRDDMLVPQITAERFEVVLRPKLSGAWVLHRLTRSRELDYFVLFSSIASGFGAGGQGSYAAANAFLDALAQWRRGRGLPAVSINWGPWSGGGMAEGVSDVYLRRMGVARLSTTLGMETLEPAMACDGAQVMVCPFDWATMKGNLPWVRRRRFLEAVDAPDAERASTHASSGPRLADPDAILDQIRSMTPDGLIALIDRAAERVLA